ncbi:MAG: DUF2339 domain-containing protein, partial [Planctomycetota bacterium]
SALTPPESEQRASSPAGKPDPAPVGVEQLLGTRGMLFVGLIVLLLGGVFFLKFAIDRGWIDPLRRVILGAAAGLGMIALGQWALLRRHMRTFAAAISAGGLVMLYFVVFVASPNGWYKLMGTTPAFALMCSVTVLGVGISVQMRLQSGAILSLIGALATPILLSTGENRQVLLMNYLLAVNVGFLAAALWRRFWTVPFVALVGTAFVFAAWAIRHIRYVAWPVTLSYSWAFVLLFIAAGLAMSRKAARTESAEGDDAHALGRQLTLASATLGGGFWLATGASAELMPLAALLASLGCLFLLLMSLGLTTSRQELLVLAWLIVPAGTWMGGAMFQLRGQLVWACQEILTWGWLGWLAMVGCSVGIFRRPGRLTWLWRQNLAVGMGVIGVGMALAHWLMLREIYPDWMGIHAAIAGALLTGMVLLTARISPGRWVHQSIQPAMILVILAFVPLQMTYWPVTLSWLAMGLAGLAICNRLREPLAAAGSVVALALAQMHYWNVERIQDPVAWQVVLDLPHLPLTPWLLLGAAMMLGMVVAARLVMGMAFLGKDDTARDSLAAMFMVAAVAAWLIPTGLTLPQASSSACWLALAAVAAAAAWMARSEGLSILSGTLMALWAGRWFAWDLLLETRGFVDPVLSDVGVNWKFVQVIIAVVICLSASALLLRRVRLTPTALFMLRPGAALLAAGLLGTAVTVELWRFFRVGPGAEMAQNFQVRHMSYSVWWALLAATMVAIGFVRSQPWYRYAAIGLFAVTLIKVFFVDMRNVEAVFRIGSFVALGILLVAASWLYNRNFGGGQSETEG